VAEIDIPPTFVQPTDNNHVAGGRIGNRSYLVGSGGEGSFQRMNVGALEK
jgi:hypothetical protein